MSELNLQQLRENRDRLRAELRETNEAIDRITDTPDGWELVPENETVIRAGCTVLRGEVLEHRAFDDEELLHTVEIVADDDSICLQWYDQARGETTRLPFWLPVDAVVAANKTQLEMKRLRQEANERRRAARREADPREHETTKD